MVARIEKAQLLATQELAVAPPVAGCDDHSFELPGALYLATAILFAGFVSLLSFAFADPEIAVPWAVFVTFIAAFFTIPAIFVKCSPQAGARSLRWSELMERGIAIEHGRCSGRDAVVLVMMLPVFIFAWGVAIVAIVATL